MTGPAAHGRGERRRRLLLTALVGAAAVALTTQSSEATFTATAALGHSITTGSPGLVLGATGAATNRLGVDVTALMPGQSAQRSFDLRNDGTQPFGSYTFSTRVTTSSLLDTNATDGLQIRLERCSAPWTESGASPAFTYTCSGTRTQVVAPRPIAVSGLALTGMLSAAPGGVDHLLLTETLPSTAGNAFQNLSSAVTFTFDAA